MKAFKENITAKALTERALFHLKYSRGKDLRAATTFDKMMCFSHAVRDMAVDGFIATQRQYLDEDVLRVNYLSLEYLIGKMCENNVLALGITDIACEALKDLDITVDDILEHDVEAGLGNGGLHRRFVSMRGRGTLGCDYAGRWPANSPDRTRSGLVPRQLCQRHHHQRGWNA